MPKDMTDEQLEAIDSVSSHASFLDNSIRRYRNAEIDADLLCDEVASIAHLMYVNMYWWVGEEEEGG